jgi:hypothetical protein
MIRRRMVIADIALKILITGVVCQTSLDWALKSSISSDLMICLGRVLNGEKSGCIEVSIPHPSTGQ